MSDFDSDNSNAEERVVKHYKWTSSEDSQLRRLVRNTKKPNWVSISLKFANRNPRQCKDRWNNYLCPDINNSEWSPEEDELLKEKFKEYGSKWSQISQFFIKRTSTNVKNRWLYLGRKSSRRSKKANMRKQIVEATSDKPMDELNVDEERSQKESQPISNIPVITEEMFERAFGEAISIQPTSLLDEFQFAW